jgi:hypothetical protein
MKCTVPFRRGLLVTQQETCQSVRASRASAGESFCLGIALISQQSRPKLPHGDFAGGTSRPCGGTGLVSFWFRK